MEEAKTFERCLVLGGGGARAACGAGVLLYLREQGFSPDLIVGTSLGTLVGALILSAVRRGEKPLDHRVKAGFLGASLPLEPGGTFLDDYLERLFCREERIEDLPLPLAVTTLDLNSGKTVIFRRGFLREVLRAAMAMPGWFSPVERGGRLLIDAASSDLLPLRAARALGARRVMAVDPGFPWQAEELTDPGRVRGRVTSLLSRRLYLREREGADLLLEPRVDGIHWADFPRFSESLEAGYQESRDKSLLVADFFHEGGERRGEVELFDETEVEE